MKSKQESGYILPTTMIVIFILCAVIAEQTRHYMVEKQFLEAQTNIFQLEQLLQAAVVDLKQREHEELLANTSLQYVHGTVTYNGQEMDEETVRINLQARTDKGGVRYVQLLMNTELKVVTEWWEVTR